MEGSGRIKCHESMHNTDFIQSSSQVVEDNLIQTYRKVTERREGLITDYVLKFESKMDINSIIEHLRQLEARWQKLANDIKRFHQVHQQYTNEISESMSHRSNCRSFRKKWQKRKKKLRALPLMEADIRRLELSVKKLQEESENYTSALQFRLQSLLG